MPIWHSFVKTLLFLKKSSFFRWVDRKMKINNTTWKTRIWAFQGDFIEGSSFVWSTDMIVLIYNFSDYWNYSNRLKPRLRHTKMVISRLTARLESSMRAHWKAQILVFHVALFIFIYRSTQRKKTTFFFKNSRVLTKLCQIIINPSIHN